MTTELEPYLDEAREAGLLTKLNGAHYVSGGFADPLSGKQVVFVEYTDPRLLNVEWHSLIDALKGSGASTVVIRKSTNQPFPPHSRHHTHFMLSDEKPARTTAPLPELKIRPVESGAEVDLVLGWIATALVNGYSSRGHDITTEDAVAAARQRYAGDDTIKLVAVLPDMGAIGHATVRLDDQDEITGARRAELLDILIADGHPTRRVQESLVHAAFELAESHGLPLLGNVVCSPPAADGSLACARIVDYLARTGWTPSHDLIQVDL